MAKQEGNGGVLGKLTERGEEAVNRLMEELGKNERVTEALALAMEAKGKVDDRTRKTLGTIGLAAADQIEELRKQLERLEKRLAALEKQQGGAAGSRGRKASGAAKRSGTSARASSAKKTTSAKASGSGSSAKPKSSGSSGSGGSGESSGSSS